MTKLIFASWNKAKRKELKHAFIDFKNELQFHDCDEVGDIEETGMTFEENAILKAKHVSQYVEGIVLAEDSGLVVKALDGEPGVKTARFIPGNDDDRAKEIQKRMAHVSLEKRQACFRSVIVILFPDGSVKSAAGELHGWISTEDIPRGEGYAGLFFLSNGAHLAQAYEYVYPFTHRQIALQQAKREVRNWLTGKLHHE